MVVPAYLAEQSLPGLLAALRRQTLPPDRVETIVVDDGSPDATGAVAEREGVRVLRQRHLGPAAARNGGARAARGEILVFTDADCEPAPDCLEQLLGPFADPQVVATKGAYATRQRELVARLVQLEYEEKYARMARWQAARGGIDFVDTYAAAFRRAEFLAAGGFDESFPGPSVEDQELAFRLWAAGARMRFVPEARVWHRHAATLAAYARKKWRIGYWKVAVLRRHPGKALRDAHTPQLLKLQLALAPLPPLFLLAAVPFVLRCLRRDPAAALLAPVFLYVRALALGLGVAAGVTAGVRLPAPARDGRPLPARPGPGP